MSQPNSSGSFGFPAASDGPEEEQAIPLASRIIHKFYEPIILLVSLQESAKEIAEPPPPDLPIDLQDPKQVFQAFVNKLAHACDSTKGGATVTSVMVVYDMGNRDNICYRFAVNRQSNAELAGTAAFARGLLHKIGQAPAHADQQHVVRKRLLHEILRFNRPRIGVYLRKLQSQVVECLKRCHMDGTDENWLIAGELQHILDPTSTGASLESPEEDYFQQCEKTIRLLIRIQQTEAGVVMTGRARERHMAGFRGEECWSDLMHTIKRILAYPQSVQFFFIAKKKWPNLFDRFEVSVLPSSGSIPKPIRNKSLTAEGIIGRMTRKEKEIQTFRSFVKALQAFDLDERIKTAYRKPSFDPIVHSEVALLNWQETHDGISPERFFNGWMYIGSSKPVCKLCRHYFDEHGSGVECRSCHGNLYPSWRVPDVFPSQGPQAINSRQIMVDRVLQRVRKDAFDLVKRKTPPSCKADDSNTFSATVTLEERWTFNPSAGDIDEISSMLGNIDMAN